MNRIAFAPIVDVPLVTITVIAFIRHFNHWAFRRDIETTLDIPSRLHAARLRVLLLFICLLFLCWFVDLAVWAIFAMVLGIGLIVAMAAGGEAADGEFALIGAAYIIREWAFGFPQLILYPPRHELRSSGGHEEHERLFGRMGVTTSSLRPTGDALIDGVKYSVVSYDGGWIDVGVKIEVTNCRSGLLCVTPTSHPDDIGEASDVPESPRRAF